MSEAYEDWEHTESIPPIPESLIEESDWDVRAGDQVLMRCWEPGNPITAYWGTSTREKVEKIQRYMIAERNAAIRLGLIGLETISEQLLRVLEAEKLLRDHELQKNPATEVVGPSYLDD
jgi:hypothetical protein